MSDSDRARQPEDERNAPSTTDRNQPSAVGGDVATRSGTASTEDVEEDEPAGGMIGQGDPGR